MNSLLGYVDEVYQPTILDTYVQVNKGVEIQKKYSVEVVEKEVSNHSTDIRAKLPQLSILVNHKYVLWVLWMLVMHINKAFIFFLTWQLINGQL